MLNVISFEEKDRKKIEQTGRTIIQTKRVLYKFIMILRWKIKLMSSSEFDKLIRTLDWEQKVYAFYFRYF